MHLRRIPVVIMVGLAATALVFAGCGEEEAQQRGEPRKDAPQSSEQQDTSIGAMADHHRERVQVSQPEHLPRLIDLGRGTCIPCKKMAPLLKELKTEYQGTALVEIIDLRDDPGAAGKYGIRLIPTQIFFDAMGKEVWRHEGFLAKDAIIAKFKEMGVEPLGN